ncbi:Protein of unknown function [Gryllus bimaculatus]|nr:Protein of unknown function [Gryllus bimaculatus]
MTAGSVAWVGGTEAAFERQAATVSIRPGVPEDHAYTKAWRPAGSVHHVGCCRRRGGKPVLRHVLVSAERDDGAARAATQSECSQEAAFRRQAAAVSKRPDASLEARLREALVAGGCPNPSAAPLT